jgi:hypothetical protein
MVPYEEEATLRAICRHHGVTDNPELIVSLCRLIEWVHQSEQAKHGGPQPVFLICLEGMLGLHRPRREQEQARAA